jgi:hypothetical protein
VPILDTTSPLFYLSLLMTVTSTVAGWYHAVSNFSVEKLFSRKREPGPKRTVWVNSNVPDDYRDAKGRVKKDYIFPNNQVLTSKYTLITFIPRNLLEQFRRVANVCVFYFNSPTGPVLIETTVFFSSSTFCRYFQYLVPSHPASSSSL